MPDNATGTVLGADAPVDADEPAVPHRCPRGGAGRGARGGARGRRGRGRGRGGGQRPHPYRTEPPDDGASLPNVGAERQRAAARTAQRRQRQAQDAEQAGPHAPSTTDTSSEPRRSGRARTTGENDRFYEALANHLQTLHDAFETTPGTGGVREQAVRVKLLRPGKAAIEQKTTGNRHGEMAALESAHEHGFEEPDKWTIETATPSCYLCSAAQAVVGVKGKGGKDTKVYQGKGWGIPDFLKKDFEKTADEGNLWRKFLGDEAHDLWKSASKDVRDTYRLSIEGGNSKLFGRLPR